MSETRAEQRVSGLSEGPKPASLLPYHDPGYLAPTHLDVRAITQQFNLTGRNIAHLIGVAPRTVRKWLAPPEAENHAPMPYAAWRLLLIETGVVSPTGIPNE